jgi:hypothetical protein
MPFCPQCGNRVEEDHRFCTACGNPLSPPSSKESFRSREREEMQEERKEEEIRRIPADPPGRSSGSSFGKAFAQSSGESALTLGWISVASLGGLALVSLLFQDVLGFVLALGFAVGAYALVLKPLQRGNAAAALLPALVISVVVSLIGVAVLLVTRSMMGLLDVAAALPGYLLWKELRM